MHAHRAFTELSSLLILFASVGASPTLAASQKPDIAIRTKAVTATVLVDAKLKRDPALAASMLAEGQRWAETQRRDADKTRREDGQSFPERGYTFERNYTQRSEIAGRYVSIVRTDYSETGGAHPNADVDTIIWDKDAGKRISIRPFFTETAADGPTMTALQRAIVASLKAEKATRGVEDAPDMNWYDDIAPNLLKVGAVTLAPSTEPGKSSGLTFHFPPYAVGSYAEGIYVAFVPWPMLKPHLAPEGSAIFGGARPRADIDTP